MSVRLTDSQRAAVTRDGQDVCVIAGPGSGKTTVLIERFAWLVETKGVEADRILAITFTEKAATEIRKRLLARFDASPEYREQVERAWVSTIDGFCARLLREYAIAAELPPDFEVLDAPAADQLQREATDRALDALLAKDPVAFRQLLLALAFPTRDDGRQQDLARALREVYEGIRVSGAGAIPAPALGQNALVAFRSEVLAAVAGAPVKGTATPQVLDWCRGVLALPAAEIDRHLRMIADFEVNLNHLPKGPLRDFAKKARDVWAGTLLEQRNAPLAPLLHEALIAIDSVYRAAKRARGAVDFGDLEEGAIRLLETEPAIATATRERFDQILMDELQDTNPLQWRLVNLLRRPARFFAVGDVNQSIYGFRHAEPDVFEGYEQSLRVRGLHVEDLRENHRSRAEILAAVDSVLLKAPGIRARTLQAAREFPAKQRPSVERITGTGDSMDIACESEARQVVRRIRELEVPFREVAILARTMPALEPIQRALDEARIPFLVTGGRTFLETREVRDAVMLLSVIENPRNEIALAGVLRSPFVGLRDEDVVKVLRQQFPVPGFDGRLASAREAVDSVSPDQLLVPFLDASNYEGQLSERQRANLEKFLAHLQRRHAAAPESLWSLLRHLDALRTSKSEAEAPPSGEAGDMVRLMTVHTAKGLEFPVVFTMALHAETSRQIPALLFSPAYGVGISWRNPFDSEAYGDAAHRAIAAAHNLREEQEQNRLLYVAMTRAQDHLVLSDAFRKQRRSWQRVVHPVLGLGPEPSAESQAGYTSPRVTISTPEVLVPAKPTAGQHDSAMTATSLALFADCPRRYYLERYLNLTGQVLHGESTGGRALGLAVHDELAGLRKAKGEALELAEPFRRSALGERAKRAIRREHEFDFMLPVGDVILRGQIDLWFEEGGELVVVDYKTDADRAAEASYALQLQVYALAIERYAGRIPDRGFLFWLNEGDAQQVGMKGSLVEVKREMANLAAAQEALDFPMRPALRCSRCPFYRGACPVEGF